MVGHNYNALEQYLMRGYVNWNTSSAGYNPSNAIYVALLTPAYLPSALHSVWADVSASESAATGYTAGGQAVSLSNTYTQSAAVTTTLSSNATNSKNLSVTSGAGFVNGDVVLISNGAGTVSELNTIASGGGTSTLVMTNTVTNYTSYTTAATSYVSQYPLYTNFSLSANPTWTISAGTLSTAYAVYYINATVNSVVKPLLTYQDFGGTTTMSSGTFTITENGGVVIERLSD